MAEAMNGQSGGMRVKNSLKQCSTSGATKEGYIKMLSHEEMQIFFQYIDNDLQV